MTQVLFSELLGKEEINCCTNCIRAADTVGSVDTAGSIWTALKTKHSSK